MGNRGKSVRATSFAELKEQKEHATQTHEAAPTLEPEPTQTETPSLEPTQTETPVPVVQSQCNTIDGIKMKVVYLDWISGEPLGFYIKMPGGVPGFPGDSGNWEYSVDIGEQTSTGCTVDPAFKDRLYCNINLASKYSLAVAPLNLTVNTCETPVYVANAYLPGIEDVVGGGSKSDGPHCSSGLDAIACSSAGGAYIPETIDPLTLSTIPAHCGCP